MIDDEMQLIKTGYKMNLLKKKRIKEGNLRREKIHEQIFFLKMKILKIHKNLDKLRPRRKQRQIEYCLQNRVIAIHNINGYLICVLHMKINITIRQKLSSY